MMHKKTGIRLSALNQTQANYYGAPVTKSYGSVTHVDRFGTDLVCRNRPVPPVAEYESYLRRSNSRICEGHHLYKQKTGTRLRRIVIMRREGCSWKECGEPIGISAQVARRWVEMLPLELSPDSIGQ